MSKSTKTRKKRLTNMSGDLLKELQALVAFACYDSPSLIRRGGSLAEVALDNMMSSIFYGDDTNGAPDPDLILFEDQCMLGLNKFKGLYTQSVLEGPSGEPGEVRLSIPAFLHRHKNLHVYVGDGSIEKGLLSQKSLYGTEKITGRTLHRMAKTVLRTCKKMMAIVKSKGSPYKDGRFPSGTNWEDYILWCLIEMSKECDREEAARIDAVLKQAVAEKVLAANATGTSVSNVTNAGTSVSNATNAGTSVSNATNAVSVSNEIDSAGLVGGREEQRGGGGPPPLVGNGTRDEDGYPDKKFFQCGPGFLAWALWGHIPIHDSACMQTDFFGSAKKNASFGRNTESNAAIVDNRRGKKRHVATDEEEASTLTPPPSDSSKLFLVKTLQFLNADSLEKERQKSAQLMIRNVRDKLTARRRNEDSIDKEVDRFFRSKRKPGQALLDKQAKIENEIALLEQELDVLQNDEYRQWTRLTILKGMFMLATMMMTTMSTIPTCMFMLTTMMMTTMSTSSL
jgi:hypothetical protein